jgi:hypothetical protein
VIACLPGLVQQQQRSFTLSKTNKGKKILPEPEKKSTKKIYNKKVEKIIIVALFSNYCYPKFDSRINLNKKSG